MKPVKKKIVHIYLALWCIYNLQGILYTSGAMLSQILFAVLIAWSMCYFIIANNNYKLPKVMKVLTTLVIIWTVYGVITLLSDRIISWIPSYNYLKNIYMALLPIYAFFVFTKRGQLTAKNLSVWLYVFLVICIARYYLTQQEWLDKTWRDEVTNNSGYLMLSLLPLLPLLRRKPVIQYAIFALLMYFVLHGFKRGAIIAGAIASIFFLFGGTEPNKSTRGGISFQKTMKLLLTVAIIVLSVYFVQQLLNTSDYFNEQIDRTITGDGSGRDVLYTTALSIITEESNPFIFLFGYGGDATLRLLGNYAHNDWLEIAVDNGLLMIVLYIVFWIALFLYMVRVRKKNNIAYIMIGLFFIIYFLKTFFSMAYNDISCYAACALGYALAIGDFASTDMESR